MYSLRHEGRGWVRVSWTAETRPTPTLLRAIENADRVPGVIRRDFSVSLSPTALVLPGVVDVVQQAVSAGGKTVGDWRGSDAGLYSVSPPITSPARPLFDYQTVGVERIVRAGSHLLADEMGLGKTPQAIVAAQALAGGAPVLIIGPRIVRDVWRRELEALGVLQDPEAFCALESRDFNHPCWNPEAQWYFCHYDVVRAWNSRFLVQPFHRRPAVVILDEAHYVKNPRTQRAKGTYLVAAQAPHRIVLTGTPIEARPSELWPMLRAVNGPQTWGSSLDFRRRYASAEHDGFGWRDGDPSHIEELHERLEPWYTRRTADEVGIDLPALTRTVYPVEVDEKALVRSRALLDGLDPMLLVQQIARGEVKKGVLERLTKLRSITSRAKLKATRELLDSLAEQQEHAVVFAWARETVHKLGTDFTVTGEQDLDDRTDIVATFQGARLPVSLAATYDSLSVGVTLTRSRIVILHDLDWRLTTMLQAELRVRRIGQKRACQSLWIVGRGTVDELIARALLAKAEVLKTMLGTVDDDTLDDAELVARAAGVELEDDHVEKLVTEWVEAA